MLLVEGEEAPTCLAGVGHDVSLEERPLLVEAAEGYVDEARGIGGKLGPNSPERTTTKHMKRPGMS